MCANKLGEHSSLGQASYTQTTYCKFTKCNYNLIVSFNFAVYKYDEINYSIACEKKMLVAIHTSTIITAQREPEILTTVK